MEEAFSREKHETGMQKRADMRQNFVSFVQYFFPELGHILLLKSNVNAMSES